MRSGIIVTLALAAGFGSGAAAAFPLLPAPGEAATPVRTCFYADGWNGPGLYECGYRLDRGVGWLGSVGTTSSRAKRHGRRLSVAQRRRR